MNIKELNTALEQSLEGFKEQIKFDLNTFEQNRLGPYLNKDDIEEIARQTFYLMCDFQEHIIKYLKAKATDNPPLV
jgi:hypothetical protein